MCGVDGSPGSRAALRAAAELADRLGLRLVLTHATPNRVDVAPGFGAAAPVLPAPPDGDVLVAAQELDRLIASERLESAERRVVLGTVAGGLVEVAKDEAAELIVVGTPRTATRRLLCGSVSNDLIGMAPCPVLVVPSGERR